ncbi:UNVERIFIED_CONTAM: Retrovirus-related Pol polyprotein from transposon TNT 1-94 [Sesamum latifolium]|uniref:Retrovirus-related Pol polyprotein from transposon TNT 1-94 n=1 Tax=Sesamum latifolium TaxID=2727402 RepID=A0AAW2WQC0_9LAMI
MMSKERMVKGLPPINHPNQLCEGCLYGKQARKSFPKESMTRAQHPLELIHSDVCGPITHVHLERIDILLFIDDYSRKTWVYFLKEKSEVFGTFKKFKAMVENQSGFRIKALRSDRGVYLMNRSYTKSVHEKTPQEAWSGYKPVVTHLRVFGSIAYTHIPHQKRTKLDDKSASPFFDDEEEDMVQPITPPSTPPPQNIQADEASSSEGPRGFRRLRELYDVTEEVTNLSGFTQFCLFAETEPVDFNDAARDEKWRNAMDEEIKAIENNDSWELESYQKAKTRLA